MERSEIVWGQGVSGEAPELGEGQPPTDPLPAVQVPNACTDVFISYASQDAAIADAIVAALERHGVACWIAPRDVTPGEFYADAIVRALNEARILVLVLTENAVTSPHVLREVERTSAKRHAIVSLRLTSVSLPPALEYFLSASHWLDASASGINSAMPKLVESVKRLIAPRSGVAPSRTGDTIKPAVDLFPPPPGTKQSQRPNSALITIGAVIAVVVGYLVVDRLWVAKHSASGPPVAAVAAKLAPPAPAISERSVAVLPFVDMSEKKDQEYFADGLAEELLNLLSQLPDLHVAARTSAFSFKGKSEDIPTIGRKLLVANVLEGSVRRAGARLRITAQLVRADNGYHLWSQTYDRKLDDVFKVEDEIAAAVVKALKVSLLERELPQARQTNPKTYALHMQAQYLNAQGTAKSLEQAISLYQQAVTIDPTYTPAWAGLARVYVNQANRGMRPVDDGFRLAREAAEKALAIDPGFAAAYARLGDISLNYDRDLVVAARSIERALALEPTNYASIFSAASLVSCLGRVREAVRLFEYLAAHDPANPSAHVNLGVAYFEAGRFEDAITSFRTAQSLSPRFDGLQYSIGIAQLIKGDREGALATIQQEQSETWRLIGLAMAYHSIGKAAESDTAVTELISRYGQEWPYNIAYVMAWRGEADRAFEWLDRAAAAKDTGLTQIIDEPSFKRIHTDPRWLAFLKKIGSSKERLDAINFAVKLPGA